MTATLAGCDKKMLIEYWHFFRGNLRSVLKRLERMGKRFLHIKGTLTMYTLDQAHTKEKSSSYCRIVDIEKVELTPIERNPFKISEKSSLVYASKPPLVPIKVIIETRYYHHKNNNI